MNKKTIAILLGVVGVVLLCLIGFIIFNNQTFEITFDAVGGSQVASQQVKRGDLVLIPVNPTKSGYEFVEWDYNGKKYDFSLKVSSNMTLVAVWGKKVETYTVSLELDGVKKSVTVKGGFLIDQDDLVSFEKEGYNIEWYMNGSKFDVKTDKVTKDILLTGKYVEVKVYTVSFDSDGGSSVANQKVNENNSAKEPDEPTKQGFVFDSWYLDNKKYDFKDKVTKDITLKAKWIEDKNLKRYEVKFNSDGGSSVATQTIVEGKKVTQPKTPIKSGYLFDGWYLNNNKYDFSKAVTKDITLVARWVKELGKFTVSFDSNGGTDVLNQVVYEGSKAVKPNNPTRINYTFKEWQLNGKAYDFNSPVTSSIILKAAWTAIPRYVVSFDSNGGSKVESQTIIEGNRASEPANPIRSGYTFGGWQLNGSAYNFNAVVTSNITLVAKWNKEPSKYTVSFNSNGGSRVDSQTVVEGNKVSRPSDPTRSGYIFGGWQLNGSTYNFDTVVTGDITLTAVWNEVPKYTVSFDSGGGSRVESQIVAEGNKASRPSDPTRNGYTFDGWQLNGSTYNFDTVVSGNITLTAVWSVVVVNKTYTIEKRRVDNLSLDVQLIVKEDGQVIPFTNIMFNNRVVCTSSNPTVNANSIGSITTFQVTLTDGTVVSANVS